MKRVRCIILGMIPIANFVLQYYFAKKEKKIAIFQKHRTCYRGDWIFVPINVLVPLALITISRSVIVVLWIISLSVNYLVHYLRSLDKTIKNSHLVMTSKISKTWWVHMIFSSIEMLIIVLLLLSPSQGRIAYATIGLLLAFVGILNYGEYRIHRKLYRSDMFATILLWWAVLIKILSLI
jgi:hypothetical protein